MAGAAGWPLHMRIPFHSSQARCWCATAARCLVTSTARLQYNTARCTYVPLTQEDDDDAGDEDEGSEGMDWDELEEEARK